MSTPSRRRRRASAVATRLWSRRNSAVASAAVGALVAAAAAYMYWSANSKKLTKELSERKRHVDAQMQDLETCNSKLQAMWKENLELIHLFSSRATLSGTRSTPDTCREICL